MGNCIEIKHGEKCEGRIKEFKPTIHYWNDYGTDGMTLIYERWCPKCYIIKERVRHYSACSEPEFR